MKRLVLLAALSLCPAPAFAHGVTEQAQQRMLEGGYLDVAWIGAEHMLTGYDHLLFLLGMMLFLTRFGQVVTFITAFTVGHALTLLAATPAGIGADPRLIDAIIALTVIYKAFENLEGFPRLLGVRAPPLLPMVFAFGLIHGFGLSTRLQEMTLAQDPQLIGKILAFNVGVEFGQCVALAAMVGAIRLWRESQAWPVMSRTANAVLIAGGLMLFSLQMHAFVTEPSVAPGPIAFVATAGSD